MQKMQQAIILWCIGNPLLLDAGAGPALFSILEENSSEHLNAVNCETTPENFITPLARFVRSHKEGGGDSVALLIADAADMGLPGGSIRRMKLGDFENVSFSSHGIPLPLLLAPLLPELEVVVLGIQPAERGFGDALSPEVGAAVERLARLLLEGRWDEVKLYQEN